MPDNDPGDWRNPVSITTHFTFITLSLSWRITHLASLRFDGSFIRGSVSNHKRLFAFLYTVIKNGSSKDCVYVCVVWGIKRLCRYSNNNCDNSMFKSIARLIVYPNNYNPLLYKLQIRLLKLRPQVYVSYVINLWTQNKLSSA